jgi:cyclic pyranopterin phosphate synthase
MKDENNELFADGLLRQESDDVGERVHICIGAVCNNNCIFCMEEDRAEREDRIGAQTDDDVLRIINENKGTREILFTSGEPTLNRSLPAYIASAAAADYEVIGVISNGRLFSYAPFAAKLLRAGLNNIIVSIHGHDTATHDALTRTKGSFDQTYQGLVNLSQLKSAFNFKLQTSTVVTKRNLPFMQNFCELMAGLDIDAHAFNVMMPDGGGRTFIDRLMPLYTDVTAEFRRILPMISPEVAGRMALVDIPYCTTQGLPDSMRGYVERYFHYEPEGSFEARAAAAGVSRTGTLTDEESLYVHDAIEGADNALSKVTRTFQEAWVKSHRPECRQCRYLPVCRGVWKAYSEKFGWDEFVPVVI